jgi:hypothetical protein
MNTNHIRMAKNESRKWNCQVSSDGEALSLTGCSLSFTVKSALTQTDGQALFQLSIGSGITLVNTVSGVYTLEISTLCTSNVALSANNQTYYFDHRIKLSTGAVKQLESGQLIITPCVTNSIV